MLPEHTRGMVAVRQPAIEHLVKDRLPHLGNRVRVGGRMASARRDERCDRGMRAVEPGVRVAHRQDHPRLGIVLHQLAPIACSRPVDLRPVSAKNLIPIHALAMRRGFPVRQKLRVVADLEYVMARPEPEMLQRDLQRVGAGPAKARAD
jgi:hypothetical protein